MGNLYIKYETTLQSNETYWFSLMTELLPVFTEVEVHCREDEKEEIHKIKPYAHTIRFESGFVIFTMPLNQRLKDLLLYAVSEGNRVIPWFKLGFKRNGSLICTVKQNGTELFFYQISIEDAKEIESYFPENTAIEFVE